MEKKKGLKKRKIDLCICIKNRAALLDVLFDTIEKSTANLDCNIIFVDGLSSDATAAGLIEFYNKHKENCTIKQTKAESTYVDAYNEAMKTTVSDYICWLDSDDMMDYAKLETQSKFLDDNQEVDVVSCTTYLTEKQVLSNTIVSTNDEQISNALKAGISMKEICHFQSCMFRRKCIKKFKNDKYFYDEFIGGFAGEGFLYLLHFNGFKFANISNTLYIYTKGMLSDSLTNKIEPTYSIELSKMEYDVKKKSLMKLFRKYNKKQEDTNGTNS